MLLHVSAAGASHGRRQRHAARDEDLCGHPRLLGCLAGRRKGLKYDAELLYAASMFHDIGLTARYEGSQLRFEVDGANAARDFLRSHGISESDIETVQAWREAGDLFDPRERAALGWAESVTRVAETGVPDEDYEAMRDVFPEKELVDLTLAIGLTNTYNRMAISFRNTPRAALKK